MNFNKFYKNIAVLVSGTVIAQFLGVVSSPFITRIYGPEEFGVAGTFISLIFIFGPLATLTYPLAIVIAKNNDESFGLIKLSLLISFLLSTLVGLTILVFSRQLHGLFGDSFNSNYALFLPLSMIFYALWQVMEQSIVRLEEFKIKATCAIFNALFVNASKLILGFIYPNATTLILTSISSYLFQFIYLFKKSSFSVYSAINLKKIAIKYKDFPMYRAPEISLNTLSQSFPVLILASKFGVASAGYYTLARTMLTLPVTLIGNSVGDVFYPKINNAKINCSKMYPILLKTTKQLALVGLIPFSIIAVFGEEIFALVFGSEWSSAGVYAQWITVWIFFLFLNNPSVKTIPIIGKQKFQLKFTVVTMVIRLMSLYLSYIFFKDDVISIAIFCCLSALVNIFLILKVFASCKAFDRENKHA